MRRRRITVFGAMLALAGAMTILPADAQEAAAKRFGIDDALTRPVDPFAPWRDLFPHGRWAGASGLVEVGLSEHEAVDRLCVATARTGWDASHGRDRPPPSEIDIRPVSGITLARRTVPGLALDQSDDPAATIRAEPGSVALVAIGVFCLFTRRWRRVEPWSNRDANEISPQAIHALE